MANSEVRKEIPIKDLEELLKCLMEARQPSIKFVSNFEEMKTSGRNCKKF